MFQGILTRKIVIPSFIFLSMPGFCWGLSFSQTTDIGTPPSKPLVDIPSLFNGDMCSPPCWFGLTPGESTAEDASAFFELFDDYFFGVQTFSDSTFDPSTGYMIKGTYHFRWIDGLLERNDIYTTQNQISLDHGLVSRIEIDIPQIRSLGYTLSELGTPDVIVAGGVGGREPSLFLYYLDVSLLILLNSTWDMCSVRTIRESFWIDEVGYYPIDYHLDPRPIIPGGWARLISQETWEAWGRSAADIECREAWSQLQ